MLALIPFPEIDPVLFSIPLFGIDFALRWYALSYIAGIIVGWRMGIWLVTSSRLWPADTPPMSRDRADDMLTWIVLGILLGGRIGYVLFYKPAYYFDNPAEILVLWQGGMAFHGGMLGVILGVWIFTIRHAIPKLQVTDMIAICVPPGLFFGRLANFINAELWGRQTDVPWAMKFPSLCQVPERQGCPEAGEWFYTGAEVARHPSQLYEAGLEGLVLGTVLFVMARRGALKTPGLIAGVFFAGYGAARFFVEYFREPDAQFVSLDNPLGFVISAGPLGVTMGQLLSLPMIALGIGLILYARRRPAPA